MTVVQINQNMFCGKQLHEYPLPQPMLIPVIMDYAVMRNISPEAIQILKIEEGHGRHVHDERCWERGKLGPGKPYCFLECDDSDWIVTLEYRDENEHRGRYTAQAVYGIKDGKPDLWMD